MAMNDMPLLASGFMFGSKVFAAADSTNVVDLTTVSNTKVTRIENLAVSYSQETTDRTLLIIYHDGTTNRVIAQINVPAGTGPTSGSGAGINVLAHGNISAYAQTDDFGNKFLDLPPGHKLQLQLGGAMTSTYTMGVVFKGCYLEAGQQMMLPTGVGGLVAEMVNATGTGAVDATVAETTPVRVDSMAVTCNDTAKVLAVNIHNGSTAVTIAYIPVAQNSGYTSSLAAIDVLKHANMTPFVQTDAAGNKFIDLPANHKLTVQSTTTVTAGAYAMRCITRWAQYGASSTLNYDARMPHTVAGRSQNFVTADSTTTYYDIVSADSNGPIRVEAHACVSNDSTGRDVVITMHNGTTGYQVAVVNVPTTSGFSPSIAPVDVLRHANLAPFAGSDSAGNKYIELPTGWKMQAVMAAAVTAACVVMHHTRWAKYGF